MRDGYGRVIDYLRVSVTDRCNLRCTYCMPETGVAWVPHGEILTYEQIVRLCRIFAALGVKVVRLTGGEPLVRSGLPGLVRELKGIPGIQRVALTTNGLLLSDALDELVSAGLDGVNISVDAAAEDAFTRITRRGGAGLVLRAVERALLVPHLTVKLNCVLLGENDDQLVPLAALARTHRLAVRFIELMPIGAARGHPLRTRAEAHAILTDAFGGMEPRVGPVGSGPCEYYAPRGFLGEIGFIAAVSHRFCSTCNRVRLTAAGRLKTCLQYGGELHLKAMLEDGATDATIAAAIRSAVREKPAGHAFHLPAVAGGEGGIMSQIGG